jgi:hypothetical protein
MVDYWSMATGGDVIDVQAPVNRPEPVQRPGGEMAPRRAPAAPAQAPVDYWSQATRPPEVDPSTRQAQSSTGTPEPDAASWLGRRWQDIRGKQDPSTANLPTFLGPTMEREFPDAGQRGSIAANIALGQSDESLAKLIGQQLGSRFRGIRKDANGYDIVQYVGQDGNSAEAYVNRPGLDLQDVARGVAGAAPYVVAGGAVNAMAKGLSLIPRLLAQGTGQGLTAAGTDVAAAAGGVADFDIGNTAVKSGLAAGFGAGGEALGAAGGVLWRRFVTEPSLYDKAAGRLTPKGAQAARDAGLDPLQLSQQLQQEFASGMAASGNASMVANKITNREFGIPRTKGELTQDAGQLLKEQHIRSSNYGAGPAERMKALDEQQRQAIQNAALGTITDGTGTTRPGLAQQIAPGRASADYGKAEVGSSIRQNTQAAYDTATEAASKVWDDIPAMRAKPEAMSMLAQRLDEAIGEFPIPKGGKAEMIAKELDAFIDGKTPEVTAKWQTTNPIGDVDKFRRRIKKIYDGADDATDKAAARTMYNTYNEWIGEAAEQSLLAGGSAADAAKLKVARGLSRSIHEVFDGPQGTPGARILADVLKKADSAEGVVNSLFSGPKSEIKGGTITALSSLKKAYDTHLAPEAAKAAWDDIRLAYFLRMVQDKSGNVYGAQALQSNINQTLGTQASVARMLYTPAEVSAMRRFAMSLQGIEKKNLNRSWSGVSAAGFARDFFSNMIAALGFNSKLAQTAGNFAGAQVFKTARGHALASDAMSGSLPRLPAPSFGGYGAAIGARSSEE